MKKNIAIVTGGDSSELVISLKSAEQVYENLNSEKYNSYIVYIRKENWHVRIGEKEIEEIPINQEDFSFIFQGRKIGFNYVFVALHGPPGDLQNDPASRLAAYFFLKSAVDSV